MLNLLAPFLGSLASGGFGLLGAQQSASSQQRTNMINAAMQQQTNALNAQMQAQANATQSEQWWKSFFTSQSNYLQARRDANKQWQTALHEADVDRALQKQFAQHGVAWRAADARAAGIHPLAAMGAQLAQASPIQVGGTVAQGSVPSAGSYGVTPAQAPQFQAENFRGQALANMGQDISRAITATAHEYQRQQEVNSAAELLKLENMSLENQLLQAQIARTRGAGTGPPMPVMTVRSTRTVTDSSGNTKKVPVEYNVGVGPNQSQEGVSNPDISYGNSQTGYPVENPKILSETGEDDAFSQFARAVRNRVLPSFGINQNPPAHIKLGPGEYWYFHWLKQEYQKRQSGAPIDARNFNWGY